MIRGILFEQAHHKLKLILSHYDWTEVLGFLALLRAARGGLRRATTRSAGTFSACVLIVLFEPGSVALIHCVRFGLKAPANGLLW